MIRATFPSGRNGAEYCQPAAHAKSIFDQPEDFRTRGPGHRWQTLRGSGRADGKALPPAAVERVEPMVDRHPFR